MHKITLPMLKMAALIGPIVLTGLVAALGSYMSQRAIRDGYYDRLVLGVKPPRWLFGVMWTIIYIAFVYAWVRLFAHSRDVSLVVVMPVLSIFLNLLWVYLFFGVGTWASPLQAKLVYRQGRAIALPTILALLLTVLYLAVVLYRFKEWYAFAGMVVYIGWLLFATYLNATARER